MVKEDVGDKILGKKVGTKTEATKIFNIYKEKTNYFLFCV
jgi:hypothetical protein